MIGGRQNRPHLTVELAGCGSLISGYRSRELIEEVAGRPPVWMARLRGWSTSERTARNVVALAESRHYDITVVGADLAARRRKGLQVQVDDLRDAGLDVDRSDIEVGLW